MLCAGAALGTHRAARAFITAAVRPMVCVALEPSFSLSSSASTSRDLHFGGDCGSLSGDDAVGAVFGTLPSWVDFRSTSGSRTSMRKSV